MVYKCKKCGADLFVLEEVTNEYSINETTGKADGDSPDGGEQGRCEVWCRNSHEGSETGFEVDQWSAEDGATVNVKPIE